MVGRKEYHASLSLAESDDTTCPRHSETLPVTNRSPVLVCIHSSTTCATSAASTNFSSTRVFVVPTTCRRPGSITEKISLIRIDLPPPFSRNSTDAGDGRRGTRSRSSTANRSSWTTAWITGPTPRRSRQTSW